MEEDKVEGHVDPNEQAEHMETEVGVPENAEKSGKLGPSEEGSGGEEHVK